MDFETKKNLIEGLKVATGVTSDEEKESRVDYLSGSNTLDIHKPLDVEHLLQDAKIESEEKAAQDLEATLSRVRIQRLQEKKESEQLPI